MSAAAALAHTLALSAVPVLAVAPAVAATPDCTCTVAVAQLSQRLVPAGTSALLAAPALVQTLLTMAQAMAPAAPPVLVAAAMSAIVSQIARACSAVALSTSDTATSALRADGC